MFNIGISPKKGGQGQSCCQRLEGRTDIERGMVASDAAAKEREEKASGRSSFG